MKMRVVVIFEPPKEMPLTPEGDQRLTVVIARKHAVAL